LELTTLQRQKLEQRFLFGSSVMITVILFLVFLDRQTVLTGIISGKSLGDSFLESPLGNVFRQHAHPGIRLKKSQVELRNEADCQNSSDGGRAHDGGFSWKGISGQEVRGIGFDRSRPLP